MHQFTLSSGKVSCYKKKIKVVVVIKHLPFFALKQRGFSLLVCYIESKSTQNTLLTYQCCTSYAFASTNTTINEPKERAKKQERKSTELSKEWLDRNDCCCHLLLNQQPDLSSNTSNNMIFDHCATESIFADTDTKKCSR